MVPTSNSKPGGGSPGAHRRRPRPVVLVIGLVLAAGLASVPAPASAARSAKPSAPPATTPSAPPTPIPPSTPVPGLPAGAPTNPPEATPAPKPAGPDRPLGRPASVVPPTDRANPMARALAEAQRSGTRVQIPDRDTENETTWANPDGTLTTDIAAGPLRVRQGKGLVPVDPTLVDEGGTVRPKAAKGEVRLSGGGAGADLASLGHPGARLSTRWASALPKPTLDGDTATYRDVVPGGDLVVKVLTTGYEVFLVLRSRPAASPVIRLPLGLEGLRLVQEPSGSLRLFDNGDKEVAASPTPVMSSAARDPQADEPTQVRTIPTTVEPGARGPELVLRPDPAFLADPATAYPVTIDPAGTLGANLSTFVSSDYPNNNYDASTELKVGTWNGGGSKNRSFVRFNDAAIKNAQVLSATLNLYETWSYSCNATPMWVQGAPGFAPGRSWNTQPAMDGVVWNGDSFYGGYSGCPASGGWKNLNLTGLVQAWSSNGSPSSDSVGLRAPNEADSYQWKKFASVNTSTPPSISVNYNPPGAPSAPQNVVAYPGNGQATVAWAAPAYGGQPPLDAYWVFYYVWNGSTWVYVNAVGLPSTARSAVLTGLVNGATYVAYVYSHNSIGWGGWGVTAAFVPAAPPTPVQNLVANGGNTVGSVRWVAPASNGGLPVDFYLLAVINVSTSTYTTQTVCGTCTWTTFGGLTNGTPYNVAVWPHNPSSAGYGAAVVSNNIIPGATDPMSGAGERSFFTQLGFPITDRMSAKVNVGTGNLEVSATDIVLPTVGGSLPIGRTYNSQAGAAGSVAPYSGALGWLWRSNQSPDFRLLPNASASTQSTSATFLSGSGNSAIFTRPSTSASFATQAGLDSDLQDKPDGSYLLTVHASNDKLSFRADGQLTRTEDRNGNRIDFAYPDGRRATTITANAGTAPGNSVSVVYGGANVPNGQLASVSQTADGVTRAVSYDYDGAGNLFHVYNLSTNGDPPNATTTFLYNAYHDLTQITDPAGHVTQFGWDGATHRVASVTKVIPGGNAVTTFDYSQANHTKVTDPLAHPVTDYTTETSGSGRVTDVRDARGKTTHTDYTPNAKVGMFRNAAGGQTTNTYGANNSESLTSSQGPTGAKVSASFNNAAGTPAAFLPDSVTDSMGNASLYTYDTANLGNIQSNANANDEKAELRYNPDGTVATSTDPKNGPATDPATCTNCTRYGYNAAHQLTMITPPQGSSLGVRTLAYDGFGRLRTATAPAGNVTTTYTYDTADHLRSETHSDGTPTITSTYGPDGTLTTRTDATGITSYTYDAAGRLTAKTVPGGPTLAYGYDKAGNLTSLSGDGRGTTSYGYNTLNLLDQMQESTGRWDVFAYNDDHQRTDTWYNTGGGVAYDGNGNVVPPTGFAAHLRSSFDNANNLTHVRVTGASSDADGNRLADLTYRYDLPSPNPCPNAPTGVTATAVRQAVTDNLSGATTAYCYDRGGHLKTASTAGGPTYAYSYDTGGNRTSGPEGAHPPYNSANQATDPGTSYDPNGNLTAAPGFSSVYNGIDAATSVTTGGQTVGMAYAGSTQDERVTVGATTQRNGILGVQAETTAGANTYYERDSGGTLVSERTTAGDFYYYFDGLGSVIGLVDPAGNQRAAYTYDPYGANATAIGVNGPLPANPWRYTSGYQDPSGLYKIGARYYDPALGRWTQQDSIVQLGNPGNGNRYIYTGSDPVNYIDPSGRIVQSLKVSGCYGVCGEVGFEFDFGDDLPHFTVGVGGGPEIGADVSTTFAPGDVSSGFSGTGSCSGPGVTGGFQADEQGITPEAGITSATDYAAMSVAPTPSDADTACPCPDRYWVRNHNPAECSSWFRNSDTKGSAHGEKPDSS